MILTVSPWLVWAVLSLALFGAIWLARGAWRWAWDAIWRLVYWWKWDRGTDEDDDGDGPLEELPPEQSAEELGFTGEVVRLPPIGREVTETGPPMWEYHRPERERRAQWWEAEHRAAYESLGFDYPSGLMARVRELTP